MATAPASVLASPFLPAGGDAPQAGHAPAEIRAETMDVTPELARQWTDRHVKTVAANRVANSGKARDNRTIRWGDDGVAGYARDMKAGRWDLNGESLKIAWDGTVPDGQHRLYACIEAGVPFRTVVVTGVEPKAQDTIDIGIGRKFGDQLAIANEPNAVVLASVTRWSLRWLHGARGGTSGGGPGSYKPTRQEMLDFLALTHLGGARPAGVQVGAGQCLRDGVDPVQRRQPDRGERVPRPGAGRRGPAPESPRARVPGEDLELRGEPGALVGAGAARPDDPRVERVPGREGTEPPAAPQGRPDTEKLPRAKVGRGR